MTIILQSKYAQRADLSDGFFKALEYTGKDYEHFVTLSVQRARNILVFLNDLAIFPSYNIKKCLLQGPRTCGLWLMNF